jgi:PPOX class probable F420-dependent enzyme
MSVRDDLRADFLRRCRNAIVATNRAGAGAQLTPNWYLWDGERFLICTAAGTSKIRNLRRDARMSLCIDDVASNGEFYVTAYGTAEFIDGAAAREPALAIIRKYQAEALVIPHWNAINEQNDQVVIAMRPDHWVWGNAFR